MKNRIILITGRIGSGKSAVEGVKGDVKVLARQVQWLKDSVHVLNVKLDSLAAQNRLILEILQNPKTKKKIH